MPESRFPIEAGELVMSPAVIVFHWRTNFAKAAVRIKEDCGRRWQCYLYWVPRTGVDDIILPVAQCTNQRHGI
eukprot:12737373-Prorocentrum_lima.AAC.1